MPSIGEVLGVRIDGLRTSVPILGSGVNLQAARAEGSNEDDWAGLLARIARELNLDPGAIDKLPKPHLFRWEAMLRLWARIKQVEPFEAEVQLQKITCAYLRSLEAVGSARALYREISAARFADVISLNFDRRVALSLRGCRFMSGPNPCPEGSHGETLYRHDLLAHAPDVHTRIWYPHGDTKKFSTLKLGVRKYGFYIGTIGEAHSGSGEYLAIYARVAPVGQAPGARYRPAEVDRAVPGPHDRLHRLRPVARRVAALVDAAQTRRAAHPPAPARIFPDRVRTFSGSGEGVRRERDYAALLPLVRSLVGRRPLRAGLTVGLKALERTLQKTTRAGRRTALLWLGNGMHIQAARESGLADIDAWASALRRIARRAGVRKLDSLPRSQPLLWDAIVHHASVAQKRRPAKVGPELGVQLLLELQRIEKQRRRLALFGRILDLGFENILSMNIDRTLAMHSGRERFAKEEGQTDAPFYRHSVVEGSNGAATRVWYPHGDTHDAPWIRLGTSGFQAELMDLESWRSPMMKAWIESRVASWSYPGAKPHTTLKTPGAFYEQVRRSAVSWYPMVFVAPLVVVGASLPLEDWPIWWLLHQRARNLTPFRDSALPPAFFLTAKEGVPAHLVGRPSDMEVIEFPSHDALWRTVLRP